MIEAISLIRHLAEKCQLLRQRLQQMIFRFNLLTKIEKFLAKRGDGCGDFISSRCLAHEFEEEINETPFSLTEFGTLERTKNGSGWRDQETVSTPAAEF